MNSLPQAGRPRDPTLWKKKQVARELRRCTCQERFPEPIKFLPVAFILALIAGATPGEETKPDCSLESPGALFLNRTKTFVVTLSEQMGRRRLCLVNLRPLVDLCHLPPPSHDAGLHRGATLPFLCLQTAPNSKESGAFALFPTRLGRQQAAPRQPAPHPKREIASGKASRLR